MTEARLASKGGGRDLNGEIDTNFDPGVTRCPLAHGRSAADRLRRWSLAGIGVACVGVGGVGVFVPGLPTTIFLIIATFCFARSCPWLEHRLVRTPLFGPYLRYVDGGPIPTRARITALVAMWACVSLSLILLAMSDTLPTWLAASIVLAAAAGTLMIVRFRRAGPEGPRGRLERRQP